MNTTTHPLIYRINVAGAKLGVSRATIYRLIADGKLKLVKISRQSSGVTAASVHAMIEGPAPANSGESATARTLGS